MMVDQPTSANAIVHTAGGYGPPGGGGYPPGGGYGGPPPGAPPGGFGGPPGAPPGGGYGVPPGAPPPGNYGGPPPGGFGPPGGGFPPPGAGPAGGDVNTTLPLVLSIISLACCGCLPMGIAGIIYSMNANNAKKTGDLATAQSKAKTALILSIIGMVGGAITYTIIGVWSAMNNGSF